MQVLVIGGSQGARILSDVVPPAIAALPMHRLRHICVSAIRRAPRTWTGSPPITPNTASTPRSQPFFHDVPERMAEAQLVIARAGASTVADLQRHRPARRS